MGMSRENATYTNAPIWLFVVPFVLFIGYLGVDSLADTYRLQTRGQVTAAKVSDRIPLSKGGVRVMVTFSTQDSRYFRTPLKRYRSAELGDTIQVEYDPSDPANLQQAGMRYNYLHGLFRVKLALGIVAFGMFVWWRNRTSE